ncbi:hypothetical protein Pcinc_007696 [Petrolisthes cinctipes]|uniref:Uncharacterized protein n=1 Tax=Petrolisthes cinctipes TaxID=88211 RepID=A0AAE1G7Z5_PETCI|nr:hypothetical protein Pcinc_007696 [Petrolisthes cinctipes]
MANPAPPRRSGAMKIRLTNDEEVVAIIPNSRSSNNNSGIGGVADDEEEEVGVVVPCWSLACKNWKVVV